jgi:hypothetical protein
MVSPLKRARPPLPSVRLRLVASPSGTNLLLDARGSVTRRRCGFHATTSLRCAHWITTRSTKTFQNMRPCIRSKSKSGGDRSLELPQCRYQRVILESWDATKRIEQLESLLEKAAGGKIVPCKRPGNAT